MVVSEAGRQWRDPRSRAARDSLLAAMDLPLGPGNRAVVRLVFERRRHVVRSAVRRRFGGHARKSTDRAVRVREASENAKILATTYFPERLPSQYLRRWRA